MIAGSDSSLTTGFTTALISPNTMATSRIDSRRVASEGLSSPRWIPETTMAATQSAMPLTNVLIAKFFMAIW